MYKKNLGIDLKMEYVEWPVFQKRTDEYGLPNGWYGMDRRL